MDIGFLLDGTLPSPFCVVKKFRNKKSRHVQLLSLFLNIFFLHDHKFYNKHMFLWIEIYFMTKRIRHRNCLFPLIGLIVAVTVSVIRDNATSNSYEGSYSQYICTSYCLAYSVNGLMYSLGIFIRCSHVRSDFGLRKQNANLTDSLLRMGFFVTSP